MPVEDNLPEVEALLDRLSRGIQFTDHGIGKSIGEEALDICSEGIADRTVQGQRSPDGSPMAELTEPYKARKVRQGFPELIAVRTGEMMSLDQLKGERAVSGETATMAYGKDQAARDKMGWITAGRPARASGNGGQPPRPVWGLDDEIHGNVDDYLRDRFLDWLGSLKGGV